MHLFLTLRNRESMVYRVIIRTMENKGRSVENELSYTCSLSIKGETLKGNIVNIKRSQMRLNKTKEQSPVNELLFIAGEILSDLDLEISRYGKILKIKNYPHLLKEWKTIKFRIESTYKGEIVENIVSTLDRTLQNHDSVIASLAKDPFFYNYLMGIYGEYINGKISYEGLFGGMSDMPLKITKHNKLDHDDMGNIHVGFYMKIVPESLSMWQTKLSANRGSGVLDASIKGDYYFLSENSIRSVDSCFEAYWDQQLFKRIKVNISLEEK